DASHASATRPRRTARGREMATIAGSIDGERESGAKAARRYHGWGSSGSARRYRDEHEPHQSNPAPGRWDQAAARRDGSKVVRSARPAIASAPPWPRTPPRPA